MGIDKNFQYQDIYGSIRKSMTSDKSSWPQEDVD